MLKLSRVIDRVNAFVGSTLCYLVLFVLVTGVYEVSMRYFLNRPTVWVWELNGFLLCPFVALGGGYALLTQTHVRVDILYDRFSERTKAIVDLFSSLFMFLFLCVLLWQTTKMSLHSLEDLEHTQTMFAPPIYPFKALLAVGIFLFVLQGLSQFLRNLHIALTGRQVVDHGT